jgi:ATP-dependent Lon protease
MEENLNKLVTLEDALPKQLILVPIKVRPVFPGTITPLIIPPGKFVFSIDEAINRANGFIGLVLLKNDVSDEDSEKNIFFHGVIARIFRKIQLPDGGVNILVNTIRRFKIDELPKSPILIGNVSFLPEDTGASKSHIKAMMRALIVLTKELSQNNPLFTEEMKLTMLNVNEPGKMADFVCSILNLEKEEYQAVLEANLISDRLEKVLMFLKKEIDLISLQRKIQEQINEKIDKQQRNFFLREQLKAIQQELGGGEDKNEKKYQSLITRMEALKIDESTITEIKREIEKYTSTDPNSTEYGIIKNYLDILESLPWEPPQERKIDISHARHILNRDHYKLEDVKERILEHLAVRKLNANGRGSILLLVGPPGVGKTSIVRSIAEAMGRKFFRFSVGGLRDEAEIKGHRRTYIGAIPGKIINGLRITREKDMVFLIDEIDKLSSGIQGDPASALLEALDPEQNSSFRDHYLDLPFDLSNVFFIATANSTDTIPRVLLDRMEVINLSGYITEEKVQIFTKYLWKKCLSKNGLDYKKWTFDTKTIPFFINSYSRESGLRGLEKMTDKIARKIALKIVSGEKISHKIKENDLKGLLGVPPFTDDRMTKAIVPGTALGLAWTSVGGSTLLIEAIKSIGKEATIITGQMGKMMEESTSIAISYIKSNYPEEAKELVNHGLHIHVPDGATPKDGPSAGITIATAVLSLIRNEIIKPGFAMTGEITLTGEVLEIGGLREKIVAAKRVGIKHIILPNDNKNSLEEVPAYVKKGVKFYPVSHYKEVESLLFKSKKKKQ